jgi:hypothetical protein
VLFLAANLEDDFAGSLLHRRHSYLHAFDSGSVHPLCFLTAILLMSASRFSIGACRGNGAVWAVFWF